MLVLKTDMNSPSLLYKEHALIFVMFNNHTFS